VVSEFAALLSPPGPALLAELSSVDDLGSMRLATALRQRYPSDLVAAGLTQVELRRAARTKFTRADQMFFTRAGLEQASTEVVSRHRAVRFADRGRLADLCTGIGGDLIALADGHEVLAVDLDSVHLRMALLNAGAYGVSGSVEPLPSDVRDADLYGVDAAFVDPARRTSTRRLRTGDSEPPLDWCLALADRVPAVGVKLAPGLDRAAVPDGWELEFVADRRELKEAAIWSPALATTTRRATILPGGDTLVPDGGGAGPVGEPAEFLLDPNPAVTRAGLVEELARLTGTWKIDEQIAFLAADRPVHTPFARTLRVLESAPWKEKLLAARLRALGIGAVDIRRRGLAGNVEQLHHRLKLTGHGRKATLVMTRKQGQPWSLVCVD
jgi:THUMP domain-containing protein/RNA cap guanine-N2 methyltransferase